MLNDEERAELDALDPEGAEIRARIEAAARQFRECADLLADLAWPVPPGRPN